MYKIAVIPGDGVGKEVMNAALHILDGLNLDFEYEFAEAGDKCAEKTGEALPDETLKIIKNSDACLFGAAGETAADVIVKLRRELDLFVNLRPVKSLPGVGGLYGGLDFVIVRENTEDLYVG
ncbi:MAG TPA: NAD-dependent isocitrate dehydrogenase, partial [Methanothermobacter sp.]|nr:NAD-dependent isocitrate dehydrogenase [Methanothermobacter sp.]